MNKIFEKIAEMPLIAILRGITPEEAEPVSDILVEKGFTFMEVTLNSIGWQKSLRKISRRHGDNIVLGAGTVLADEDIDKVRDAGGKVIISPNINKAVIRKTKKLDMVSVPGCFTPTECFSALAYGADILKIFPADNLGASFIRAMTAVLPEGAKICPTGGVTQDNMGELIKAGVFAMGMGTALYKPGKRLEEVAQVAENLVSVYRSACRH